MMANAQENSNTAMRFLRSLVPWLIGGAIFGFALGLAEGAFGFDLRGFVRSLAPGLTLDGSGAAALALGGLLVAVAIMIGMGTLWPSIGIKMKVFTDAQDRNDQMKLMGMSALGCFAWGGILVMLALADSLDLAKSVGMLAVLGLLVAILAYTCRQLMFEFDELWHEVNRTACTWAFYGSLVFGGGWSMLAHIGLVAPLAALDWITMLTALSLIGAVIANGRRGLLDEHL